MDFAQIGIMIFGCSAVWLVGRKSKLQRWGYKAHNAGYATFCFDNSCKLCKAVNKYKKERGEG